MAIGTQKNTLIVPGQAQGIADITVRIGGKDYAGILHLRPATPVIYNVSTTDATWTAIATGLTNVMNWRLSDRSGRNFYYAFVAAPTTYATAFGWVAEQTEITAIYVKRIGSVNVDGELVVWTP